MRKSHTWAVLTLAVLVGPFLCACAHPLESVVEANRQQRIGAAYAGKPITSGAGDGIGAYIAQSADNRITLPDRPKQ